MKEHVRYDRYTQEGGIQLFPVQDDEKILPSIELSDTIADMPVVATDFVFIDREHIGTAKKWIEEEHNNIIKPLGAID